MKKKLVTIITFLVSITLFSQNIDHTWNYPIKPGTKEWQNLKTPKERINAYNIPDSILYKISTKNLVKSCLNYPDMIVIMHRDDLQSGYNYLKTLFNGFEELEKRPDAGKELIEVYKKILVIDGGQVYDANIIVNPGGTISLVNSGEIIIIDENQLTINNGGAFNLNDGEIKIKP